MNVSKLAAKIGLDQIKYIIDNAHNDAVYYVDEWTDTFGEGVHGYYRDKFLVGRDNPHTHYRLSALKEFVKQSEQLP